MMAVRQSESNEIVPAPMRSASMASMRRRAQSRSSA